jgi:hypothetical protein
MVMLKGIQRLAMRSPWSGRSSLPKSAGVVKLGLIF